MMDPKFRGIAIVMFISAVTYYHTQIKVFLNSRARSDCVRPDDVLFNLSFEHVDKILLQYGTNN